MALGGWGEAGLGVLKEAECCTSRCFCDGGEPFSLPPTLQTPCAHTQKLAEEMWFSEPPLGKAGRGLWLREGVSSSWPWIASHAASPPHRWPLARPLAATNTHEQSSLSFFF